MNKIRTQTARFFAIAIVVIFYGMSHLPQIPDTERAALASALRGQ